eukprot:tig00020710_g13318.t1
MAGDEEMAAAGVPDLAVIAELKAKLVDRSRPLSERMRTVFSLRNLPCPDSVDALAAALDDESALLKHELAYCMGQMREVHAIPVLTRVLRDVKEDAMVRHEAAEALGAIGDPSVLGVLEEYAKDPIVEVAETCQIAVAKLRHEQSAKGGPDAGEKSEIFHSVDPAPPCKPATTEELRALLLDKSRPLFERYRAMFALRNKNDEPATLALCDGFDDGSALFRHEIAYVLGQMQHAAAVPALTRVLQRDEEAPMVRHEAAEALGAIAAPESLPLLEKFRKDHMPVVSDSCKVALDMHAYYNSGEFQYADVAVGKDSGVVRSH